MLGATFLLALREIRRHILRSILTTLGIIIGVAAVVTMVTLGNGVTASVQDEISSLGASNFIVFPVRTDRGTLRPFDQDDVDAVQRQIAGVTVAAGNVTANVTAFHNGQDWDTSVTGANRAFLEAQTVEVTEGRAFTRDEETAGKNVCLLGLKVREEIFLPDVSPLGEQMRLNDVSCIVVGVLEERGQGASGADDNDTVFMPLKTVQRRFRGNDDLDFFVLKYDAGYASSAIQDSLVDLLRERRLLRDAEANDFNVIDTAQVNDALGSVTGALTAMVAVIASISLLVGGIGIMNIMLVSVTERTREIGIRLAIGALAREVRLQFLTEAVVLCALGGLVGLILAFLASISLASAIEVPFVFDPTINILALAFCAFMGIVFGYYPARRASQLDPIEALRHE
ncbi:ABC transporter permease [Citromicrobium bathyomarinum]|jgi:putative ABC transport system permease protein|uniref:ABC transporter permease n=1 Tax=Sphingomonadales TaxID=204457 RepID=UPI000C6A2ACA|nr:ABC transporter permease [Citromicrobium sp.]MBO81205.1 multidrug ABC transporter substrate-binding protein [Citromicrobium sp.]|tara:strand:- start:105 stop:1301 length:1197 start_codon:yes stop_codon:yes gene_type:complete